VTIAGTALAKKHHWKIRPVDLQSVKAANIEHMLIEGVANVSLATAKRSVRHEIHITPDLDELILGSDWMAKQGRLTLLLLPRGTTQTSKSVSETATSGLLFTASSLWVVDEL